MDEKIKHHRGGFEMTLKDKRINRNDNKILDRYSYFEKDVKKAVEEFVKELKQRVSDLFIKDDASEMLVNSIVDKLNKDKFGFDGSEK